ncbi:MAG: carboxypeptidase regulatory-like domain-containing protein [Candidatus Acidiferrales bacterium]
MRQALWSDSRTSRKAKGAYISRILVSLACLFLAAAVAYGLEITGTIIGTVTDANGGVIIGADVTVTNVDTGVQNKTVTGSGGFYTVPNLAPGKYDVSVEYKGFKTGVSSGNVVQVNQNTRVDVSLSPGNISEKVVVTSQAPLVASTTSDLSTTLEPNQINSLPLNGRLFQSLLTLAPGTTPGAWGDQDENPAASGGSFSGGSGTGSYASVNGFFFGGNLLLVNGVHDNEPQNDYITMPIPLLDIGEYAIDTSNPSAQYGTFGGSVENVTTKSGGNSWHGGAFDYIRNDAFNAIDAFSTSKAPAKSNQFGGAIGGPIKKDKLFIFGDFQMLRQNVGTTDNITVPTTAMRGGNLSALDSAGLCPSEVTGVCGPITNAAVCQTIAHAQGISGALPCTASSVITGSSGGGGGYDTVPTVDISPIATAVLAPTVTAPTNVTLACATNATCNNSDWNPVNVEDPYQFDVKVDYAASDNDRIFAWATYFHRNFTQPSPGTNFEPGGPYAYNNNDLDAFGWDHIFSPTMSNDLRVGFNRYDTQDFTNAYATGPQENNTLGIPNGNLASFPETFGIADFNGTGFALPGGAGAVPDGLGRLANIFEYNDTLTKIWGRHSFKFGTDIERLQTSVRNPQNYPPGTFNFGGGSSAYTGYGFADFLLGAANTVQRDVGPTQPATRVVYAGFFVQDDFRVTQKLTLNLGLRYDVYTAPKDAHNLQSNFVIAGPNAGLIQLANSSNTGPNVSTYFKNFEPRIGLAYSPDKGKTAFRAAFGISDFPANFGGNGGTNERNYPETLQENNFAAGTGTSNVGSALLMKFGLPGLAPVTYTLAGGGTETYASLATPTSFACPGGAGQCLRPPAGFGVFDVSNDFRQDEVYAWNISIEREITHDMSFIAAYVGNKGYHLYNDYQLNTCNPPSVNGVPASTPGCLPFNSIGFDNTVDFRNSGGDSAYNAGQFQLIKRTSIGLTLQASYTWSKLMSNIANPEDPYDTSMRLVGVGWESSNYPQNFTFAYVYDLPFGKNRKWASGVSTAVDEVIGGWQVSGVTTFRAGGALGIGASGSMPSVGSYSNYANFTCAGAHGNTNPHTINEWFNVGCFSAPANYTYGNGSVGDVYGPGLQNWDFSIHKGFYLGSEDRQLKFSFDFYNFFNHVNLNNPGTGCSAGATLTCTNAGGFGVINSDAGPRQAAINIMFLF